MYLISPRLEAEDALNREMDDEILRRDDVEELQDARPDTKEASDLLATLDFGLFVNDST